MRDNGEVRVSNNWSWRQRWVRFGVSGVAIFAVVAGGAFAASATKTPRSSIGVSAIGPVGLANHVISMKATGFNGVSATGTPGNIEVNSFTWAIKGSHTCAGCGRGAGRPTLDPFVITRPVDAWSPTFMQDCAQGRVISSVIVYVTPASTNGSQDTLTLSFKDAIVTDVDWSVTTASTPVETVTMMYRSYKVIYNTVPLVVPTTTTSTTSTTTTTTTTVPTITTVPQSTTTTTSPTAALG